MPEIFIMLITASWIIALIHCVTNGRMRGNKVGWILLIVLANWVGALIYFLYWYGFAKHQQRQTAPAIQQVYPLPEQNYPSYAQGYQPVRTTPAQVKPFLDDVIEQEENMSSSYEQIQVMYPEDPR